MDRRWRVSVDEYCLNVVRSSNREKLHAPLELHLTVHRAQFAEPLTPHERFIVLEHFYRWTRFMKQEEPEGYRELLMRLGLTERWLANQMKNSRQTGIPCPILPEQRPDPLPGSRHPKPGTPRSA